MVNKDTFCILPFSHITTTPSGEIKLCCRARPNVNANVKDPVFDLEEYWNGEFITKVRTDLLNGVKNEHCGHCWKLEERGVNSQRLDRGMGEPEWADQANANVQQFINEGKIDFKVPLLELKLSNVCNMKCRMCWPKDSSLWYTDWDKVKKLHDFYTISEMDKILLTGGRLQKPFTANDKIKNQLYALLDHVDQIEFAGGEPIIDPLHLDILSRIKHPENVILKYSTNLHQISDQLISLWKTFANVKLTISIDGYRELNEKIRKGSDWDTLKANIQKVRKEVPGINIKGSTCISALNALELKDTICAIINDLDLSWHQSTLTYPRFLCADILSEEQLSKSLNELQILKTQILNDKETSQTRKIQFSLKHIKSAIKFIDSCIKNNQHITGEIESGPEQYMFRKSFDIYEEYIKIIDEIDNEE